MPNDVIDSVNTIWENAQTSSPTSSAQSATPTDEATVDSVDSLWVAKPPKGDTDTVSAVNSLWTKQPIASTSSSSPVVKAPTAAKVPAQPEPSFWQKTGKVRDDLTSIPLPEYVAHFMGPRAEASAVLAGKISNPEALMTTVDQVAANYMASSKHPIISKIGKTLGGISQFEQNAIRSAESPVGVASLVAGPAETVAKTAVEEAPSFIAKVAPTLAAAAPKVRAVADTIFSTEGLKSIVVPKEKNESSLQYAQRIALGAFQTLAPIVGHVVPSEAAKNAAEQKTTIPVSGEVEAAAPVKPVTTHEAEIKAAPKAVPAETKPVERAIEAKPAEVETKSGAEKPNEENPLNGIWETKPTENAQPTIEIIKPEEAQAAPGGHAGNGVASVEELNRPGRFVKISAAGQPTDLAKSPDFGELKPGEAGYQVKPDGSFELKAGQETDATKLGVQNYAKEVFGNKPAPVALPIAKVVSDDYIPTISKDKILAAAAQRIVNNSPIISGMIDPAKLQTPEDIGEALGQVEDHVTRNLDPRVGVRISLDAQKALAADLNMPVEDLLAKHSGVAYHAEQSLAARSLLRSSALDLQNLAKQAAAGDAAARSKWAFAAARHLEIENQVLGIRSEAGRGLGSWRVNTLDLPEVQIGSALAKTDPALLAQVQKVTGKLDPSAPDYAAKANQVLRLVQATQELKPETLTKAAQLIAKLDPTEPGFIGKIGKITSELKPSTTQDKVFEVYRNGLLSSPATVIKKSASEATMMMLETTKKAMQGGIESLKAAVGPSDYARGEARAADACWFSKGAVQTLWNAKKILSGEFDLAGMPGFEHGTSRAIKGVAGQVVRAPSELINRLTNLVYAMNYYGELNARAARQAISEGLDGEALAARQEFLAQNPTQEMMEAANKMGLQNTFQNELGDTGKKGALLIQSNPVGKVLFPFYRTPINIVKQAFQFSPYGYYKGLLTGDAEMQVKGLIGAGIAAAIANMAMSGLVTGGGPIDFKTRQTLEATGWQPYSLKIGNKYISFNRAEPVGLIMGLGADAVLSNLNEEGAEAASRSQTFVNYLSRNIEDLPFLMQISGVVDSLTHLGEGNTAERVADNLVASAVVPAGIKNVAQAVDPTMRTPAYGGISNPTQGLKQTIESRVPGLTKNVPADIDVTGQPVKRTPSSVGGANPFPVSTQKNNPVLSELARLGVSVENQPQKTLTVREGNKVVPIPGGQPTPAEAQKLQKLETQEFYRIASSVISNPSWKKIPDEEKKIVLSEIRKKVDAGRYGRLLLIRKGAA